MNGVRNGTREKSLVVIVLIPEFIHFGLIFVSFVGGGVFGGFPHDAESFFELFVSFFEISLITVLDSFRIFIPLLAVAFSFEFQLVSEFVKTFMIVGFQLAG